MKMFIVMLFSATMGFAGFSCVEDSYAQETKKQIRTIDGQVSEMDWVASKLVVDIGGDQMTFILPDNVVVAKGTEEVSVNDVDQDDAVTVYYYDDGVSGLKVVKITDNSPDL